MNLEPSNFRFIGILPYSYNEKGELLFLLGRERAEAGWTDQLKWSGFGGKPEKIDNSIYEAAAREGYEETMGIFGNKNELLQKLVDKKEAYIDNESITFTLEIDYAPNLSILFRNIYNYIKESSNNHKLGYLEKIDVRYFTPDEIINNKSIMRPAFYNSFQKNIYSRLKRINW